MMIIIMMTAWTDSSVPNFVYLNFYNSLGNISTEGQKIIIITEDARETSYLFQRISIMLQRFNSVLLHNTLPVDLPDL